jgi:NitT/TauT family transport system permease protein
LSGDAVTEVPPQPPAPQLPDGRGQPPQTRPGLPFPRVRKRATELAWRMSGLAALIAAWVIAAIVVNDAILMPSPPEVLDSFKHNLDSGLLWSDIRVSTERALLGFGAAVAVGIPVGLLMGWWRRVDTIFGPIVAITYPIPKIAMIPLFILWLGIGNSSKVAVIATAAVFPVILNTHAGVRSTSRYLVWSARTLGASTGEIVRRVVLPHSLPLILVGMRLAMGLSWLLLFAAEMVAADSGLGFRILYAQRLLDTPTVFMALITIALLGWAFDRILLLVSKLACGWYYAED